MPQESRTPSLKGPNQDNMRQFNRKNGALCHRNPALHFSRAQGEVTFRKGSILLSLFTLPLSNLMMVRGSCVLFSKQCVGSRQKHLYGSEACASNDQIGRHWSAGGFVGISIVDERKYRISSELNLKT